MSTHDSGFFRHVGRLRPGRGDPTPKYLRIAQSVAAAIESGHLQAGSELPSQREMAEYLGVTVMTLRQAISALVEQGHLRVEQGLGTFVTDDRYRVPIGRLTSFTDQIRSTHQQLDTRVLSAGLITAPRGVPARMGLAGNEVYCLTRLRIVDSTPLVYSMSLLAPEIGGALDVSALGDDSLYHALDRQLGIRVTRAVESFRAALLSEADASALGRHPGEAAMISSRLTFSSDDVVVVDDRAIMPGDSVVISTERHAADSDVQIILPDDEVLDSTTVRIQEHK